MSTRQDISDLILSENKSILTRSRIIGLFVLGIMLLVFAGYNFITILTPRSSLVPLAGTLEDCDININDVSSRGRYGSEDHSRKAALIFYLHEFKKKFELAENIGDEYKHEKYERLKNKLNLADSVTVWIKKSEINYWEPTVFEIVTDREVVLEFQSVRTKDSWLTIFLLVMGLFCVLLAILGFYPDKFLKRKGWRNHNG